jgi:hypothetical protein
MPTGVSSVFYPDQPKPLSDLELNNSYFLVRLHDAQAFFEAGWLVRPGFLVFSSSVESSFQPGSPTQSLHQITALQKNTPCHLGISTNLTDWLPARATDSLKIILKYTVVQDTPFRELLDQMNQVGLASKLSLVKPDWAVAVRISDIVGRLLSYLLQEGSQREVFSLAMDLNLASLHTGYYAVVGSHRTGGWPASLRVDESGRLTDLNGNLLLRHSYTVVEVLALPRRGPETARDEPWWELLQTGKEQILDAYPADEPECRDLLKEWRFTLVQVRALARKSRGYLLKEINQIIHAAQVEIEEKLLPKTTAEALGAEELPSDWQNLLDVRTERELRGSVQEYQNAITTSRRLVEKYRVRIN